MRSETKIKFINHTGKKLLFHYATGPCGDNKDYLDTPEGVIFLDPEKVAGAVYIDIEEDEK